VTLKQFVTLLIILTTIPVVTFVANYFFRSKWYKNAAGWNLLFFYGGCGRATDFLALCANYASSVSRLVWSHLLDSADGGFLVATDTFDHSAGSTKGCSATRKRTRAFAGS
jgi:hypothetical protein